MECDGEGIGGEIVLDTTKKQHYIWRYYLAPWTENGTKNGRIAILRDNYISFKSLGSVAYEDYFYEIGELSEKELTVLRHMFIDKANGVEREILQELLDVYQLPYTFLNRFPPSLRDELKQSPEFEHIKRQTFENYHGKIEYTGKTYIDLLRQGNLHFWNIAEQRHDFVNFLCTQYFRTKQTKEGVAFASSQGKELFGEDYLLDDVRPQNMWLPIALITATKLGLSVATGGYGAILLHATENSFIVGDQPILNTHVTFDCTTKQKNKIASDQMELFCPITPQTALLVTKNQNYQSGNVVEIGKQEVDQYNALEWNYSSGQLFASSKELLEKFIT